MKNISWRWSFFLSAQFSVVHLLLIFFLPKLNFNCIYLTSCCNFQPRANHWRRGWCMQWHQPQGEWAQQDSHYQGWGALPPSLQRLHLVRCLWVSRTSIKDGVTGALSMWLNTHLAFHFKEVSGNFIIKLITSPDLVSPYPQHFCCGVGREGGRAAQSLNHSLCFVHHLGFFPLFLTCTFSGSDTGRLRGNKNQMDRVRNCPNGYENVGSCQAWREAGIFQQ